MSEFISSTGTRDGSEDPTELFYTVQDAMEAASADGHTELSNALAAVLVGVSVEASGKMIPVTNRLVFQHVADSAKRYEANACASAQCAELEEAQKYSWVASRLLASLPVWAFVLSSTQEG